MRSFSLKAASLALALGLGAAALAPQPAQAGSKGAYIAAGILGGLALGTALNHHYRGPYYHRRHYSGYRPYRYRRYRHVRRYRRARRCGYWRDRCAVNWGWRNPDYYGCLRYYGC